MANLEGALVVNMKNGTTMDIKSGFAAYAITGDVHSMWTVVATIWCVIWDIVWNQPDMMTMHYISAMMANLQSG